MESRLSLALATKLRMMFEKDDRYLTFPLGTGFTYRYLNFMKEPSISGLTLQEQINNKGDFARLLNIIPEDSASFSQDASRFLWDELIHALTNSEFAESGLTEAENNLLNQAIDFLTDAKTLEDGTTIPINSAALNKYYEYKTICDQAEATYLNEKITVESSTGAEGDRLKQQWATNRERQLRDTMNQAGENWKNLGFRDQVNSFQQVRNDLEPKKFLNLYRAAYLDEVRISEVPDLNGRGAGVYTTFFSPFDTFEARLPWTKITLTKSEIDTLVPTAPADLKAIFNAGEGSNDIESVALEYNNVVAIRPWLKAEFFASRYWKFADNTVVSDGKIPRHGKIPSYITSMICVRNIVVTRRKAIQHNPIVLPILTKTAISTFKIKKRQWEEKEDDTETPPIIVQRPAEIMRSGTPRTAEALKGSQLSSLKVPPSQPTHATSSAVAPITKSSFVLASPPKAAAQPIVITPKEQLASRQRQSDSYVDAKYVGTAIKAPVFKIPDKSNEATGTTGVIAELVTETFSFDGVVVLAYVCKRVPKSPDPDPVLKWL
jgi:hypothetical protein